MVTNITFDYNILINISPVLVAFAVASIGITSVPHKHINDTKSQILSKIEYDALSKYMEHHHEKDKSTTINLFKQNEFFRYIIALSKLKDIVSENDKTTYQVFVITLGGLLLISIDTLVFKIQLFSLAGILLISLGFYYAILKWKDMYNIKKYQDGYSAIMIIDEKD